MLTHQQLIDDINACDDRLALWWLGQQSYVVKLDGKVLYLDPYLSENPNRRVAPLLKPEEVTNADLIFGTHDHADHIDRKSWPAMATASPQATFVVPGILVESLSRSLSIDCGRFFGIDDGITGKREGLRIAGVAAAHELLEPDPVTGRFRFLGYVIESRSGTLYHAGDTCIYEGLQTKLKRFRLDVVMLPINGRDAKRLRAHCIGNMTYQEAADLAGALSPGLTLPGHYDMFASNGEDPQLFLDYMNVKYPSLCAMTLGYGQRHIVFQA